jgi:hypothetical protein
MGGSVSAAGDVDADGFDDFLLGVPFHDAASFDEGQVQLRSGRDGSLLRSWVGARKAIRFGYSVAGVGDTNGDGVPDVLVGAPSDSPNGWVSGAAFLYSGKDGSELRAFRDCAIFENWGQQVVAMGDIDQDGCADFAIGSSSAGGPEARNSGRVRVYSGKTGAQLFEAKGSVYGQRLGASFASAGDVDGDGVNDLLLGIAGLGPSSVQVLSLPSGKLIHEFKEANPRDLLGAAVASAGDVDLDGRADFFLGATQYNSVQPKAGFVELRSGKTGQRIYTIQGSILNGGFGSSIAVLGDLVAIAAPRAGTYPNVSGGIVTLHRVRDGVQVAQLVGEQAGDYFGRALAAAGDLDQDGQLDLMVGAPMSSIPPTGNPRPGAASIYSPGLTSLRADAERVSLSKGGLIRLQGQGPKHYAGAAFVLLGSATGTSPGLRFGPVELPLLWDAYSALVLAAPGATVSPGMGVLDSKAAFVGVFSVPPASPAALKGLRLHHAWLALDLSGRVRFASNPISVLLD